MNGRYLVARILLFITILLLVACGGAATPEASEPDGTDTEETSPEAPAEGETGAEEEADSSPGEVVTVWTTEDQPDRAEATRAILARFTEATGIETELVLAAEDNLPSLVTSAVAAGTLPDVLFVPLDFALGWVEQGILDPEAATQVINDLGPETFAAGPLDLVAVESGGYAAIPSDGWGQLLVYRQDLFDEAGLERPDSFERIRAAAEALNDPNNNFYGITASTDPSAVFTQQTFEQFALANGCRLVDDSGEVALSSPECVEAIAFFAELMSNYAPAGVQDVDTTRATYFAGQAAMVIWSPFILDEMAGLRDDAFPACPECADNPAYLAENSGIVPAFAGTSGEGGAQYGAVSYLGITTNADTEASQELARWWMDEGYLDWLALAPEGKFPMRLGTADAPQSFVEGWQTLEMGVDRKAPLGEVYGDDVIQALAEGTTTFRRWGFGEGGGTLVTAVYESLVVPQTLSDVLDGTLTPEAAAEEMTAAVQDLQE